MLPCDVVNILVPIKAFEKGTGQDMIAWLLTIDGTFTLKSGYLNLVENVSLTKDQMFKVVWKLNAPQRLKTFMWLVTNEALLTNSERLRRNMVASETCGLCGSTPKITV